MQLLGYVILALEIAPIENMVPKSMKRRLNGIFINDSVPCYLIGQLGKNDSYREKLGGSELLRIAEGFISRTHDAVGGRFIRVDCLNDPHLISFYSAKGFRVLQTDPSTRLCQMAKFLR